MKTTRRSTLAATALTAAVLGTAVPATGAVADTGATPQQATTTASCPAQTSWTNAKTAFTFFVKKGLTKKQAAGIVGNMVVESGVNPKQAQCGGGPGRGIVQWEKGSRWDTASRDNMVWYAQAAKQSSPWNLTPQLNFTWFELKTYSYYGLAPLKKTTTVKDATRVFVEQFERPSVVALDKRYAAARTAYAKFA